MLAPTELWDEPKDVIDRKALTAIATAFHWQNQIDNGTYSSQRALAAAKGVHHSYVWKLSKLMFLDPYIIRQLLDGRQPSGFNISEVLDGGMPLRWDDQRRTIKTIINRWAPQTENNTNAYIISVADATGFAQDQLLDMHRFDHLKPLVEAIIHHENGVQPYSAADITMGLLMAGVESEKKA